LRDHTPLGERNEVFYMTRGFDLYKTVQALHYLAAHLGGGAHFMTLLKLMYFADRRHLRQHAISITGDDYKAMKLGPVGSATMNVLKQDAFFFENLDEPDVAFVRTYLVHAGDQVEAAAQCDYNHLSVSEKDALDFVVANFGRFDRFQLANITHDYPEWKRHEAYLSAGLAKVRDMRYIHFLEDPNLSSSPQIGRFLGKTDPFAEDPETIQSIREHLAEVAEDC